MSSDTAHMKGIFSLPNEILLRIFDLFDLKALLEFTSVSRQFHCIALRVVHSRLQIASGLDGHEFYLECHPPAARLTAGKMLCNTLGADGLDELLDDIYSGEKHVGQVRQVFEMYSRFGPQYHDTETKGPRWNVPGDIPGSRTHPSSIPEMQKPEANAKVSQTVSIDAHDLFSQLQTLAFLGKRHYGILASLQEVSQGYIRVWREWLSRQCESKSWSDGESIVVHHEGPSNFTRDRSGTVDSVTSANRRIDPRKDPSVLWLNTRDENVGIKFRVKERKWRRTAPVLFGNDLELPVSYVIEFEEVIVRTTHLVQVLEEADRQVLNQSGKAVIFASFWN